MLPNYFCFSSLLLIVISLWTKHSFFEVSSQTILDDIEQELDEEKYMDKQDPNKDFNEALDKDLGLQFKSHPDLVATFDDDPDLESRYLSAIFHADHPINRIKFHDTSKQKSTNRSPLKTFVQKLNMLFMAPVTYTTFNTATEINVTTIHPRSYGVSSTAADHSFKNRSYFIVKPGNAEHRSKEESTVKNFKGDY